MKPNNQETSKTKTIPNPPTGMPRIVSHIFYDDVGEAIDWLVKAFDFKTRIRMENDHGVVVHGELEVMDSLIMLGLAGEHANWEAPSSLNGKIHQRMFIYIENVDAHFEQAKSCGAKVINEPMDTWHGERVYQVIDPWGHYWKFAQPIFEIDQYNLQRPSEKK